MSLKHVLTLLKPANTFRRCFYASNSLFSSLGDSPNAEIDKTIYDRYMCLPTPDCKVQAKYIWIDGSGLTMRSKTRTLDGVPESYRDLPNWGFDGSSTMQGALDQSDCILVPVAMYNDPIRRGNHKLVLCETFDFQEKPTKSNHRQCCVDTLNKVCDEEIMVGFEQEYTMMGMDNRPFGWPRNGEPPPPDFYYCGVGADKVNGRVISECFYRACLYSAIDIYGTNAEVMKSQWEFQIGTSKAIKAADDLWMARFLLHRIAEEFGVKISFYPKLFPHWNGSGMHTNISSKKMREDDGYKFIEEAIKKLEKNHKKDVEAYDQHGGKDNRKRLTGKHETSSIDKFTWGVGNRGGSVRIPRIVELKKKGFLEDRRPASNADPYRLLHTIIRSCFLSP